MSEIELKACPFCGGEAGIRKWQDEDLWSNAIVEWQKAHCTECECEGISSCPGYEPDTVQAWNTRAALTPPEGYVLVPLEPTDNMAFPATHIEVGYPMWAGSRDTCTYEEAKAIYKAMLAARPEVPNVND